MNIEERAKNIKCLLSDVDGTLTQGIFYFSTKERPKGINVKDLLGISILRAVNIKFGIITGEDSSKTKDIAKMTGAAFFFPGSDNKAAALHEILDKSGLKASEIAYIGDDINDIPVLKKVGLAASVMDGSLDLDECIHLRLKSKGGEGAIRELIEIILKAKGQWNTLIKEYHEKANT